MTTLHYRITGTMLLVLGIIMTSFDFNTSKYISGILAGIGLACIVFPEIGLKKK
ncbi:hypothetical protein [Psychroflexus sediminis]|uniref:Uncharacterized protein n=1 Tax=Psychroflexus sediminis TaxID=470826 RepID=A0A1G7Z720_9FLAO|nr:hypothetical protein [Psychroflexus sediminis]SDH04296.1 hypothetical protein SAMN04488027_11914 [Psychroflexus sediminis]